MENNYYEKAYQQARETLSVQGKNIDQPRYGRDGVRYCAIEGLLFPDRDVFIEAWGEEIADEILREHALIVRAQRTAGPETEETAACWHCTECERLFLMYSLRNDTYLEVLQRRLDTASTGIVSDELVDVLRRVRDESRQAFLDHETIHQPVTRTAMMTA